MALLRIGVIADTHAAPSERPPERWQSDYSPSEGAALARRAVDLLSNEAIDAACVLGDSANEGDHPSMLDALTALSGFEVPVWIVAGNVDLEKTNDSLKVAIAASGSSAAVPGPAGEPLSHFLMAGLGYRKHADGVITIDARPHVPQWAKKPVLLITHYPVISRELEALTGGWRYSGDAAGMDGLDREISARSAPTIVFHGHLHLRDAVSNGSLLQLGFPALIEAGHEISVVTIEHQDDAIHLTIARMAVERDDRPTPAIGAPPRSWRFASGAWRQVPGSESV